MPGGIALDVGGDARVAIYVPEGRSRDVWVTSDPTSRPCQPASRSPRHAHNHPRGTGLRSRIADNLFWLGRYAERADWTMRLMRGALRGSTPTPSPPSTANRGQGAGRAAREGCRCRQPVGARGLLAQGGRATGSQSCRARPAYGVAATLDSMHQVAGLIRDRLSVELWRTLQNFQSIPVWLGQALPPSSSELLDCLDEGISTLAAFNGMAAENMTRNYAWTFIEIGRRLERACNFSEMLLALFETDSDDAAQSSALTVRAGGRRQHPHLSLALSLRTAAAAGARPAAGRRHQPAQCRLPA